MTDFELNLSVSILQLLPQLLKEHPYAIYELAQECSKRLGQPIFEVIAPLSKALYQMLSKGDLSYDRSTHLVVLA